MANIKFKRNITLEEAIIDFDPNVVYFVKDEDSGLYSIYMGGDCYSLGITEDMYYDIVNSLQNVIDENQAITLIESKLENYTSKEEVLDIIKNNPQVSLDEYATIAYVDQKITDLDLSGDGISEEDLITKLDGYVTKDTLPGLIQESLPTDHITRAEFDETIELVKIEILDQIPSVPGETPDLSNYVTQEQLTSAIESIEFPPCEQPDLTSIENSITYLQGFANEQQTKNQLLENRIENVKSQIEDITLGAVSETVLPVMYISDLKSGFATHSLTDVISPTNLQKSKLATVIVEYINGTDKQKLYATIKLQGTSSLNYPKKNFTLSFYEDDRFGAKEKYKLGTWPATNKYVIKANYIDASQARNIVSARLWAQIVNTRSASNITAALLASPNNGAINGEPIRLYIGDTYYGVVTLNIPKGGFQFGMDSDNENHALLCGEDYTGGTFNEELSNIDGTDWSEELRDTPTAKELQRWNEIMRFVKLQDQDTFKQDIGHYFDIESLIDYYIFADISCGLDSMGKNQLYGTYDGDIYFASMYDMDSTWGLYWNGTKYVPSDYICQANYESGVNVKRLYNHTYGNLLYSKLIACYWPIIQNRYKILRASTLSYKNICNEFEKFIYSIPEREFKETYSYWDETPQKDVNQLAQIKKFVSERLKIVDNRILSIQPPTFPDLTIPDIPVTPPADLPTDYIELDLGNAVNGTTSKFAKSLDQPIDLNQQTIIFQYVPRQNTSNMAVMSFGSTINVWRPNQGDGYMAIHCQAPYDKNGKKMMLFGINGTIMSPVKSEFTIVPLYPYPNDDKVITVAINSNGIYVNGSYVYGSEGIGKDTIMQSNSPGNPNLLGETTPDHWKSIKTRFYNAPDPYWGIGDGNNPNSIYNFAKIYNSVLTEDQIKAFN